MEPGRGGSPGVRGEVQAGLGREAMSRSPSQEWWSTSGSFALPVAISISWPMLRRVPFPEAPTPRPHTPPLRNVTKAERRELTTLSRSRTAPAAHATRAKLLLLVADGHGFQDAARGAGRKSGDAVAHLVARFNSEG